MPSKNKLGPLLRKAKRDGWAKWVRGENDEQAVLAGYVIDAKRADRVVDFFRKFLRHSAGKWVGQAFEVLPWQYDDVLIPAFGWVDSEGVRLKRWIYVEIPKKNGKSTLAAGLGLYLLVADGEAGALVCTAATKLDQALIIHGEAVRMVKKSIPLLKALRIHGTTKTISCAETDSAYRAMPGDAGGSEGWDISGLLLDELHVWKNREFYDAMEYSGIVRRQPLGFIFTTAGDDEPGTVYREEHDKATAWLAGDLIDLRYHAAIYGAKPEDDPYAAATHKAANPSYGTLIDPDEIMQAGLRTKDSPSKRPNFLRRRLNIITSATSPWLDMARWDACADPDFDEERLRGRECFGGYDGAEKLDLTAVVWVFPPTDDDPYTRVLPRFFCPRETATVRAKNDGWKYLTWAEQGHLVLFDSPVIEYATLIDYIAEDRARFSVKKQGIGADPWKLEKIRQDLDPEGEYFVEFGQTAKDMTEPIETVETLLAAGNLRHNGNPVLRWCVANVVLRADMMGNMRPDRSKAKGKIDGAMGMIMGVGRMIRDDAGESVYATRGVIWV